jgi:hypothetical protein
MWWTWVTAWPDWPVLAATSQSTRATAINATTTARFLTVKSGPFAAIGCVISFPPEIVVAMRRQMTRFLIHPGGNELASGDRAEIVPEAHCSRGVGILLPPPVRAAHDLAWRPVAAGLVIAKAGITGGSVLRGRRGCLPCEEHMQPP